MISSIRHGVSAILGLFIAGAMFSGCSDTQADMESGTSKKKVIVIGFDGLDPDLLDKYMNDGRLPSFARFADAGDYKPLGTSIPPQSPVAWSNFITGMNPGGHGIYDFIHRDLQSITPVSSTTLTEGPAKTVKIGKWMIPLDGGKVENLRQGRAFWNILEEHGIPTTVLRVPANFPPVPSAGKSLSGMGTPDLLGTFGTFSYYTTDPPPNRDDISGGVIYPVTVLNNSVKADLVGPANTFIEGAPDATVPFAVWTDPENRTAKIEVNNKAILLQEKEWSDWVQVEFELIPYVQTVTGICRFYIKEMSPDFKLYVTPINIDPSNPALPISTPESYAQELYRCCGNFYTQGMPEETKALSWGVFDHHDFHSQSSIALEEQLRQFDYVLDQFNEGFLFFYFSSTDQKTHMFYNMIDPEHPSYDPVLAEHFHDVIAGVYESMDAVVGQAMSRVDENTTLILMSDHGFAPFRRALHLNTWLKDEGYIKFVDNADTSNSDYFNNVDWPVTRGYGIGFNGIYVNQQGRESYGSVFPTEREALLKEITEKLLALRDPKNGESIVRTVYRGDEVYSGSQKAAAPDLVVGYNRGYRASWETTIGGFPQNWIADNMDAWSGDHCMAAELVPGVVLSNKQIRADAPKLFDLAPTILAEFGIQAEEGMVGRPIF